jgi:hypothetical protein
MIVVRRRKEEEAMILWGEAGRCGVLWAEGGEGVGGGSKVGRMDVLL